MAILGLGCPGPSWGHPANLGHWPSWAWAVGHPGAILQTWGHLAILCVAYAMAGRVGMNRCSQNTAQMRACPFPHPNTPWGQVRGCGGCLSDQGGFRASLKPHKAEAGRPWVQLGSPCRFIRPTPFPLPRSRTPHPPSHLPGDPRAYPTTSPTGPDQANEAPPGFTSDIPVAFGLHRF